MSALLSHLRAEARRRWPAWLAVVLLVGVVGGLVIGALAGARRTSTAYDRLAADTEAWDVLVNPNDGAESAIDVDQVAALPQVESMGVVDGVGAVLLDEDGAPAEVAALVLAARDPQVMVEFARPRVVEGTLPDPSDPRDVLLTDVVAEATGLGAGDHISIGTITEADLIEREEAGGDWPPPITARDAQVSGVVVPPDGIVTDDLFDFGTIYLTPAFAEAYELSPFYYGMAIRLRNGAADVPAFREAVLDMAPGEAVEFKTGAAVEDTVERGARPHVVALLSFALVVGVSGLVVTGQALSRQLRPLNGDSAALRGLGLGRRHLQLAAVARTGGLAAAGAVLAIAVAIALSPIFPLGVAKRAEISPGLDVDVPIIIGGAIVVVVALSAWSLLTVRRIGDDLAAARTRTPGRTRRLTELAGGPVASAGLRASLGGGGAATGPARAAIGGVALAVAAVAATLTFGANLARLVATPPAYGWNWDALVTLPSEDFDEPPETFSERAAAQDGFDGHAQLLLDQVTIDGERVPAVGIDYVEGSVGPTIIAGRAPGDPGDIVLGGRTMDRLGVTIGDSVTAGTADRTGTFEVVGQAVFAGLGTYPGADRTELGKGALFHLAELSDIGEGFDFRSLVVAGGDGLRDGLDAMLAGFESELAEEEIEVSDVPQRPADVQNLERVQSTPLVIAGVLAALAGLALAFVLVSGVRARRQEIALLKTFGFRSLQVAGTVAWQATVTAVVALVIGVPAGVIGGRVAWTVLADGLGVAPDVRLPLGLLALAAATVVIANLVAVVPGRIASRTRAAVALRSE